MSIICRYCVGLDSEHHTDTFGLISSSRRWSAHLIPEVALVVSSSTSHAKSLTVSPVRPGCVVRLAGCGLLSRASRSRLRTWRSRSRSFSRRTHSYRTVWTVRTEPISWITTRYVFVLVFSIIYLALYRSGFPNLRIRANSITSRTLTPDTITTVYCDCDAFLCPCYSIDSLSCLLAFLFASVLFCPRWRVWQDLLYKYINARILNTADLGSFSQVKTERFRTVEWEKENLFVFLTEGHINGYMYVVTM